MTNSELSPQVDAVRVMVAELDAAQEKWDALQGSDPAWDAVTGRVTSAQQVVEDHGLPTARLTLALAAALSAAQEQEAGLRRVLGLAVESLERIEADLRAGVIIDDLAALEHTAPAIEEARKALEPWSPGAPVTRVNVDAEALAELLKPAMMASRGHGVMAPVCRHCNHAGCHADDCPVPTLLPDAPTPPQLQPAPVVERLLGALEGLTNAAQGLSLGEDWNNGAAAKQHGYRAALLMALPAARAALASSRGEG